MVRLDGWLLQQRMLYRCELMMMMMMMRCLRPSRATEDSVWIEPHTSSEHLCRSTQLTMADSGQLVDLK